MSYFDITMPIRSGMACYPGDPEVVITDVHQISEGDVANVRNYSFGSHTGTHFDPPFHVISNGKKADEIPADYFIGKAKVFAMMSGEDIKIKDVQGLDIQTDDIVLFKTPNSTYLLEDTFYTEYVSVTPEAAEYLVSRRIRAVGIDYLSIEKFDSGDIRTHRILLSAGIPIIEGINLSEVEQGAYQMTAMFVRVQDSDGVPLRAILKKYK